ncbi:MAG: hypothetical protein AAF458_24495 [Pseudomonadota bacterium]
MAQSRAARLRVDKLRIAALAEILMLHRDPEHLAEHLPTLRLMLRPMDTLEALAASLVPALSRALPDGISVSVEPAQAQPGSGSLPGQAIPSLALTLATTPPRDGVARDLEELFRALSTPVIGRIRDSAFHLDLRNLETAEPLLALVDELAERAAGAFA